MTMLKVLPARFRVMLPPHANAVKVPLTLTGPDWVMSPTWE